MRTAATPPLRGILVIVSAALVAAPAAATLPSALPAVGERPSGAGRADRRGPRPPIDTDLAPRFGWLPQDSDANEVQTSYKIEVRDAEGDLVWDARR